jgi:D-alanyl-D-alanine carboxypeptidase
MISPAGRPPARWSTARARARAPATRAPARPGYGLGLESVPLPCGTGWGHQGSFFGYFSNVFTTTDASSQAAVLVNADAGTLSPQQQNDLINAVVIGICGTG